MTERVRVGVIGTGIGAEHIRALQQVPEASVVAVCSAQRTRADEAARKYAIPRATDDYYDLLSDDIDALVITTPPAFHLAMARDAFAAGKHVFLEKPLAVTLDDARTLRDIAEASGRVHMINHHYRANAVYEEVKARIEAGYIGTPTVADARITNNPVGYLRSTNWSDSKAGWFTDVTQGGGILAGSAGPHLIDMLCWFLGMPDAVSGASAITVPSITLADGTVAEPITAPDLFLATLRFPGGALATVRGVPVGHHAGGGFAVEINGTQGSLITGGTMAATGNGLFGAAGADRTMAELPVPAGPWDRAGIAARFIDAVRAGGGSPAPNFADGVRVQAIIAALETAIRTCQWEPVVV